MRKDSAVTHRGSMFKLSFFSKRRVFYVGCNKAGTTTVAAVLRQFGYKVGNQSKAWALMADWLLRDFRRIICLCRTAGTFQKGWLWRQQTLVYGVDEQTLYDRSIYQEYYGRHNAEVIAYFRQRPEDMLVLNLAENSAMESLCRFLGKPYSGQTMPHLNQSR